MAEQQSAQAVLGISEAMLLSYPELRTAYDLFKAQNYTAAAEALQKTNYYRNMSETVRNRAATKLTQPGVYADEYAKYLENTRRRLIAKGINLSQADLDAYAKQGYDAGLNDNQLDVLILNSGKVTKIGGDVLGDVSSLRAYANSFGVKYDDKYWQAKSTALAAGLTTTEDIQLDVRTTSASAFPAYADQIKSGTSIDAIASAYKSSMSSILERDADSITYDDTTLRQALQYIGPDGKPAVKPVWQFEKELRSKPEWAYTNNARSTIDSLANKVTEDMFGGLF
jgi:hypothetical protein